MPRSDESDCDYLFVYGTLHPDRAPAEIADLVRRFTCAGKGTVAGTLYDLGSYPGAVLDERSPRQISGTVFRLPQGEDVLVRLDAYEEFFPEAPERSLFIRRMHGVCLDSGQTLPCWIYEYNGNTGCAAIVQNGVYSRH
jgi:gamma-glutamylcyclotransferase (GGCT)/AIG2-like uncharacterized protein YtfP